MAKQNYDSSDIEDITMTAVGEPALNYLAGVFTGVDAEFIYRSAGNGYEVQITASDSNYTRDRNTGHASVAFPAMRANPPCGCAQTVRSAQTRFKRGCGSWMGSISST